MVYYTADEVSKILKFHIVTIYEWAEKGILPGRKMGREWRFTEEAVKNFGMPILPPQREANHVSQNAPKRRNLVLPI